MSEEIYGNDSLKLYLDNQISAGRLPHALIYDGPHGSGKHTAAKLTAYSLAFYQSGALTRPEAKELLEKIKNGSSPDVMTFGLEGDRKSVGVDTVRAIKDEAYLSPNELEFKAFILEDTQLMTPAAQNALLKLLEEPPSDVFFMLLCENSATLLPTVRSRAPVLRMQLFDDAELTRYLTENVKKAGELAKNDSEALARLARSAHGSVGEALEAVKKFSARRNSADTELERQLISALRDKSKAALFSLLPSLPQKREETAELADNLSCALRDMICAKYGISGTLMFCDSDEDAALLSEGFSLSSIIGLCDTLEAVKGELSRNANLYTTQVNMLLRLHRSRDLSG